MPMPTKADTPARPCSTAPSRIVQGRPGPDNRLPLPPGHPDSWGRITAGTCTAGTPYPHPIFEGRGGRPR